MCVCVCARVHACMRVCANVFVSVCVRAIASSRENLDVSVRKCACLCARVGVYNYYSSILKATRVRAEERWEFPGSTAHCEARVDCGFYQPTCVA